MFYKSPSIIFVSDETGIYQIELTKKYNSEEDARKEMNSLIESSLNEGFERDSISVNSYAVHREGAKTEINLIPVKEGSKAELKIKAMRYLE